MLLSSVCTRPCRTRRYSSLVRMMMSALCLAGGAIQPANAHELFAMRGRGWQVCDPECDPLGL
eukprot:5523707-Heterocapsa_arctica.AAC.1